MSLVVSTAPASEALTISEAKAFARIDGTNAEPAPSVITVALLSPAAAGNVDNGAHRYLATFVTAVGETEAGAISAAVTVVDKTVNGKVRLTAIPVGGSAVTSRKLYRTVAGGSSYLLLATLADNTTIVYTDNIADSALGAGAPSTNTTEDALLTMFIAAAGQDAQQELGRYLVTQTVDLYLDEFPRGADDAIRLPPIQSVTEIVYVDIDGTSQTLATDQYQVDAMGKSARVVPSYGNSWPSTRCQLNAVRLRFVGGYGTASAVPQCVKRWMALQVKTNYDARDKFIPGTVVARLPNDYVDGMLDPERTHYSL